MPIYFIDSTDQTNLYHHTNQLSDGSFPLHYYGLIAGVYVVHQVFHNAMFVSVMAFFARISDPAVGGTYMTLLNTLTNLGGNWPATLALWAVDAVTVKQVLLKVLGLDMCYNFDLLN